MYFTFTIIIFLFNLNEAVDRSKFKTCEQSGFCNRLSHLPEDTARYSYVDDSLICSEGLIEARYVNNESKQKILLQISALAGMDTARIKITELEGKFPRLEVFKDIWNEDIQKEPENDRKKKIEFSKNKNCKIHLNDLQQISLNVYPLLIIFYGNDQILMTFNQDGLFKMENHKHSLSENVTDNEQETFNNFKDTVKRGHQGISIDTIFHNFTNFYGFPEHSDSFNINTLSTEPYRFYNLDVFEYELDSRMALYSSVPYVTAVSPNISIGLYYNNVAETWVYTKQLKETKYLFFSQDQRKTRFHFLSESGIVDFFILTGPTPKDVSLQLSKLLGFQQLPPLFAIGYHQCRWNYMSEQETLSVLDKFEEKSIPLDVLWLDIEHTDHKKYFTWNKDKFPNPKQMIKRIVETGRKLVTIVDPHISKSSGYYVYEDAVKLDYMVKTAENQSYSGWCWPGNSIYLDFFRKEIRDWFSKYFDFSSYETSTADVHTWIDMNEPSVFSGPEVTLPKDTLHAYGTWEHRDIHNVYGQLYHSSVYKGLLARTNNKERPFILTRSIFAGSQKFGAMWIGDNFARWDHLKSTIPMLLSLSISGIHFIGSDVSGFFGNPSKELFIRWYQAAIFTPFFRAHAHMDTIYREPWTFDQETEKLVTNAIKLRYNYLPLLYLTFFESHTQGSPIMRPLWYNFVKDQKSYTFEDCFMIGDYLLTSPILQEGQIDKNIYFPQDHKDQQTYWYDLFNNKYFIGGKSEKVIVNMESIPTFHKGGSIISQWMRQRRSTKAMLKDPITLVICLDENHSASGKFYIDDGITTEHSDGEYLLSEFTFKENTLESKILNKPKKLQVDNHIERIIITSFDKLITTKVNINGKIIRLEYNYANTNHVLNVRNPQLKLKSPFKITFS